MWNKLSQTMAMTSAPEVTIDEFLRLNADTIQLIDVREPEEWAMGHLAGAALIPLDELSARRAELDPRRPVVIVCRSGRRSLTAAELLLEAGFAEVWSLAGGVIAWAKAGQPIVV